MDKHAALDALRDKLTALTKDGSPAAAQWDNYITDAETGAPASISAWLKARDGREVHTLQATVSDGTARNLWTPGRRTVSAHATYAKFNDSTRYYAGVHAIHASDNALVAYDTDMHAVLVYAVAE